MYALRDRECYKTILLLTTRVCRNIWPLTGAHLPYNPPGPGTKVQQTLRNEEKNTTLSTHRKLLQENFKISRYRVADLVAGELDSKESLSLSVVDLIKPPNATGHRAKAGPQTHTQNRN